MGNTILVVEHDPDVIRAADYLLDLGPGAGELGGHLLAAGTVAEVTANPNSITGKYLSGRMTHTRYRSTGANQAGRSLKLTGSPDSQSPRRGSGYPVESAVLRYGRLRFGQVDDCASGALWRALHAGA